MIKATIPAALFLAVALVGCGGGTPEPPKSKNLNGNEVGQPLMMGRSGCERVLKKLLRDPNSLEEDQYVITEASPTSWAASMSFRSRNGFGGMNAGQAICTFDGTMYNVRITAGQ